MSIPLPGLDDVVTVPISLIQKYQEAEAGRVPIGFIAWDTKSNRPYSGTRRFKVWTTEREALRFTRPNTVVVPVYAEVPVGQTP